MMYPHLAQQYREKNEELAFINFSPGYIYACLPPTTHTQGQLGEKFVSNIS
jgi:hypothetical protein